LPSVGQVSSPTMIIIMKKTAIQCWLRRTMAAAFGGLALAGFTASGNTITPTPTAFTPGVSIVYQADLTSGELHSGDGFTVFDIGGFAGFGLIAPGWSAAVTVGSPWGTAPLGPDTADPNVTFTYTGPSIEKALGSAPFFPFTVLTTSPSLVTDDWTSRDHLLGVVGVIDGALASPHRDQILVPAPLAVPDGGLTVALLGFALVGVEGLRRILSK